MKKETIWSKDYILLLLCVTFASFSHNAFTVLFPVYVLDIGGNNTLTGFMMTGLTIAGIITRIIFGPLIDKLGRKKILVIGSAAFALNTIAYCFVSSIPALFALRVLNGVSQGIFFPVPPTLVGDIAPKNKLVDAIGFFGTSASIGASIAPMVGTALFNNFGAMGFFIVTSVVTIISFVFSIFISDRYKNENKQIKLNTKQRDKSNFKKLATIIELAVIIPSLIYFFVSFGNSSIMNFLSTFGIERGLTTISIFFLINNLVMMATRLITGRLTKLIGEIKLIIIGIILVAIATVIIGFSYSITTIIIASVIFGAGMAVTTQLLSVLIIKMVPINRRGVANSTYMVFGDIGLGIGAAVWGFTTMYSGYTTTYILSAIVMGVSILFAVFGLHSKLKNNN